MMRPTSHQAIAPRRAGGGSATSTGASPGSGAGASSAGGSNDVSDSVGAPQTEPRGVARRHRFRNHAPASRALRAVGGAYVDDQFVGLRAHERYRRGDEQHGQIRLMLFE